MGNHLATGRQHTKALLLTLLTLILLGAEAKQLPRNAHAEPTYTIVVTSLADADPPATDGQCTLREAIINANTVAATFPDCASGGGEDSIGFDLGGTITLAGPLPSLAPGPGSVLVLHGGQKVTIDANHASRHFNVPSSARLHLYDLTLTGGRAPVVAGVARGGSVYNGGKLVIGRVTFTDNAAITALAGGSASGGAIATEPGAQTEIADSTFAANLASASHASAASSSGGAIADQGAVQVIRSTFNNNLVTGASATGGAIHSSGNTLVSNSTFSANATDSSGSVAQGGGGGALHVGGGTSFVLNSTFVGNDALGTGAAGGGVRQASAGAVVLGNSILANAGPAGTPECSGTIGTTVGLTPAPNLARAAVPGCGLAGATLGTDPMLGPLADNGGHMLTHAPLDGSPTIGSGSAKLCADTPVSGLDQRMVIRPQGAACELGAVEFGPWITGGQNLTINTDAPLLRWNGGTRQWRYTLVRYNMVTGIRSAVGLAGDVTSYDDSSATGAVPYCYLLRIAGPNLSDTSDTLCTLTGIQGGDGPVSPHFALTLGKTTTATLAWNPPTGGAGGYHLLKVPLDGGSPTTTDLPSDATSSSSPLSGMGACFVLFAVQGESTGRTNALCGFPPDAPAPAKVLNMSADLLRALNSTAHPIP